MERRPLPSRLRTALSLALPSILWGALSACYTYIPLADGPVPRGREIRAYLTAAGRERVGEILPRDQRWLEGTVVRDEADGLLLRIERRAGPQNPTARALEQTIILRDGDVAAIEGRQMDGLRTGLVVGVAAVAGAAILGKILSGRGESGPGPGEGGGTDALIPAGLPPRPNSPPP
ncbi:MAG: hypothetical protein GWM92_14130 [Gemmatimonadetes bacterium]|nr:hypothetical protein [Gemmatimonadota bacterium]NIR79864.1 hypothetical protein [Gemmatimonadota bacterium]NIT88585.1 hypothetical protein [Gemmatimonadota bacterium]NIU32404.1 hypothetical protein [Gemmatimonadota bacterium]NIU36904.1 hypothetical protein [Gemmatimonadota bacterium]